MKKPEDSSLYFRYNQLMGSLKNHPSRAQGDSSHYWHQVQRQKIFAVVVDLQFGLWRTETRLLAKDSCHSVKEKSSKTNAGRRTKNAAWKLIHCDDKTAALQDQKESLLFQLDC